MIRIFALILKIITFYILLLLTGEFKSGSLEKKCYCPVACDYIHYSTQLSYGSMPSINVAQSVNETYGWTPEYQRFV